MPEQRRTHTKHEKKKKLTSGTWSNTKNSKIQINRSNSQHTYSICNNFVISFCFSRQSVQAIVNGATLPRSELPRGKDLTSGGTTTSMLLRFVTSRDGQIYQDNRQIHPVTFHGGKSNQKHAGIRTLYRWCTRMYRVPESFPRLGKQSVASTDCTRVSDSFPCLL